MKQFFFLLFVFCCFSVTAVVAGNGSKAVDTSQLTTSNNRIDSVPDRQLSFEIAGHYGFFIANQAKSYYLRDDHSKLLELNISSQLTGRSSWELENNLPRPGIALIYGNIGSSRYLGRMAAVFPYVHFPLLRRSRSVTSFRLGAGFGWVEKPFDKNTNFKNLMIGSHLNAAINLKLQSEWRITQEIFGNAGLAFTHLSNGAVRLPNLGLNIPTLSIGLRYQPGAPQQLLPGHRVAHLPPIRKTNLFLQASLAFKQTYPLENKPYVVGLVTGELSRQLNAVSSLNGGLTLAYDRSLSSEITFTESYRFDKSEFQLQGSVYIGYEHHLGRLSFPVQLGTYLYNNYAAKPLYQVIGIRYRFSNRWMAGVQLKAHFGKADYIQYSIARKIF